MMANHLLKMKKLLLIIAALFVSWASFAQSKDDMKKIESARIGLISERLGLSPDQAREFWPLYNEYTERHKELRQEFRERRENLAKGEPGEEERRRLIELGHLFKERQLNLEKDYSERLLKVISSKQLLSLRKAEEDFKDMLLRRLQQQRANENRRQQMQERLENRREMQRNN